MDYNTSPVWLSRSSMPAAQSGAFQTLPPTSSTSMWRGTETVNMTHPQNSLNAPTGAATVVNVTHIGDETRNTPALTREIAIPSPRADHEIYYHQLLTKRRGSPLWIPGPGRRLPIAYRRQGISIGDVGIITHFGGFDFLFNIFQPANHPINSRGVPEAFSPLDYGQLETDPSTIYGDNTYLTSSGLIFESTAQEAAILTMPEGALTEDLLNGQVIRDCIAENARAWYEYARRRRGRIVQNGEIRVVVGWDKVRSWGIATSTCTSGQSASLAFKINDERGTSRAYCWQCIGSGSGRVGPPEDEISDLRGENEDTPQNQCVFVRTMNFTLAGHIWDDYSATVVQQEPVSRQDNSQGIASTHHSAGGGTGNSGSGVASSHHQSSSVHGSSHTLQSVTFDATEPGIVHPSSSIHGHLLENYPNATIVITQDADWISALTDEDTSMPQTEVLCARILESRVIYERGGMVSIQENPDDPDTCDTIISVNERDILVDTLSDSKGAADALQGGGFVGSDAPNLDMPQVSPYVRHKEHPEGSDINVPSSSSLQYEDKTSPAGVLQSQKRSQSDGSDSPHTAKKLKKKETQLLHREAELEKRKVLERRAREQARAVLLKCQQMLKKNVGDDLEWLKEPISINRMSLTSFPTVNSDPGPPRSRRLFDPSRMLPSVDNFTSSARSNLLSPPTPPHRQQTDDLFALTQTPPSLSISRFHGSINNHHNTADTNGQLPPRSPSPYDSPYGHTPHTPKLIYSTSKNEAPKCKNCKTTNTPLWRRGPGGQPFCKACWLFSKTDEDALSNRMAEPIKRVAEEEPSSITTGISETLDTLYGPVPDAMDRFSGAPVGTMESKSSRDLDTAPTLGDSFDSFFFDFASGNDDDDGRMPDLVSSFSLNPSPESVNQEPDDDLDLLTSASLSTRDVKKRKLFGGNILSDDVEIR